MPIYPKPAAPATETIAINELSDVLITIPESGQVLAYDGSVWYNTAASGGATTLDALSDVTITAAAENEILKFDGSGWVNAVNTGGTGASELDELTDVAIASATTGQVIRYTGTEWQNATLDVATAAHTHDYSAVYLGLTAKASDSDLLDSHDTSYFATADHTHDYSAVFLGITAKAADSELLDGVDSTGYATAAHTHDYSASFAAFASGVTNGDTHDHNGGDGAQISYNNLSNLPTLVTALDGLSDVVITSAADDQFLRHNGSEWVNEAVSLALPQWTQTTGTFTATPPSTSTITMTTDLTASIKVGYPLKYIIGGTTYYGIATAVATNLLTLAGASLGGDVTALYYGDPGRVIQYPIAIPGYYEDANDTTLITNDIGPAPAWYQSSAYLVLVKAITRVADGSSNGMINFRINGSDVLSTALTLANTSWATSVVNVTTANYDINFGETIELSATKGTGGDAQDLLVIGVFVLP